MKDFIFKRCLTVLILLLCFVLPVSCSEDTRSGSDDGNGASAIGLTDTNHTVKDKEGKTTKLVNVQYYVVDTETNELKTAFAMVPSDKTVTPEMLMGFFIDSMEDQSVELAVDRIDVEDSTVTISFTESIRKIAEESRQLEKAVLDAVAQSILDNIDNCKRVSYSILGSAYETVNNSFNAGDIYMDN